LVRHFESIFCHPHDASFAFWHTCFRLFHPFRFQWHPQHWTISFRGKHFSHFHLAVFFIIWIDYYFDVWIVTNERIVNIEQKGLFSRGISELELENIQDITVEVLGIIPTFLNYGNLYVQTAAEKERFIFKHVPDPYAIKDLIMNLQKTYEKKEAHDLGAVIRKEIHEELN
jgi:hypothetical protein